MDDQLKRDPKNGHRFSDHVARNLGSDTAGFTLIELLVAVAVLAVLAVGASLAATRRSGSESDASRFAQSYAMARQLAVQGQARRGIDISPAASQPMAPGDGQWQRAGRETRWRAPVAFVAEGPAHPADWPEIVFLPNGRTSAFSIRFGHGAGTLCQSDGWTGLTCDAR